MKDWVQVAIETELAAHGEVRPLWVAYPDIERYSIGWRMGSGEGYAIVFGEWWATVPEHERIPYFERHLPIPLEWADWTADAIFGVTDEDLEDPERLERNVARIAALGWVGLDAWRAWFFEGEER